MNQETQLRQLIRESIQEYIREVEKDTRGYGVNDHFSLASE